MSDVTTRVELDASGFVAQAKKLTQSIRQIGQEMKTTEAKLETSGSAVEKLEAKYSGLGRQLDLQKQVTEKYKQALNETQKAEEKAAAKLDETKKAYEDYKQSGETTTKMLNSFEKKIAKQEGALSRAATATEKNRTALEKSRNAEQKFEKQIKDTGTALKSQQSRMKEWGESLSVYEKAGKNIDEATKPLQRLSVVTAAGAVAAVKFATEFEDGFANVEKTVDGTDAQLKKIKQDIIDMTTVGINGHSALPQTTAELNELAAAGGQLGIQTENISNFTETMAMLDSATNIGGESGAKTLARFMNVTATSQDRIQNLGSALVDLGNHFATTEAEIADMAMNMGATGAAVNISTQDVLAYATALSSLGTEAAAGGSSVSRIWMDIQTAVSSGGSDLEKFAQVSGKSAEEFAEAWKNNAGAAFKDFLAGLSETDNIVAALQNLGFSNIRDIQALQKLAGSEGIQLLTDALKRSNDAWTENTALVNEFEKKAETTASQIKIMKNNIIEAARSVGETFIPSVNRGAESIKEYAQWISGMDTSQKEAIANAGKWVIGLGAASKGAAVAAKGIGSFGKALKNTNSLKNDAKFIEKLGAWLKVGGSAAPLAAAGIAAVAGGVVLVKKKYDEAQYAARNFGKELEEAFAEYETATEASKELEKNISEWERLNKIISDGSASADELTAAKNELKKVEEWLIENYGIYLKSDTVTNGGGVSEEEINGLKEQNALLKETARLKAEIALHDASERYEAAKESGIDRIKEKRAELQDENDAISEQYRILAKYNNEWNKLSGSDTYKNATPGEKGSMYSEVLSRLNADMEKFGKTFTSMGEYAEAGYYAVGCELDEIGGQLGKITKKLMNATIN